jgi:nitrogen-specific signal transduction histidine kinase
MAWQYTPYTAPLLVAAGAIVIAALYVVRQQRAYEPVPGGYLAVGLSIAISFSLLSYALTLGSVGLESKLLWTKAQYLGIAPTPALLLFFTLEYTGNDEYLTRLSASAVLLIPVAVVLLVFTNEMHGFVWESVEVLDRAGFTTLATDRGPVWYLNVAYAYSLGTASVVLLIGRALNVEGIYRRQAVLLVAGVLVPMVAAVVSLAGLAPVPQFNVPLASFAVTGLTFCWGVARHGLFTLIPVASQTAVEQMDEAVVVADIRGLIVSVNDAAEPFLTAETDDATGREVGETLQPFAIPPSPDDGNEESDREVVDDPTTGRYYQRTGTPLTDSDGVLMGQLIVLRDITDRMQREQRLRQQNEQLEEFASVVSHDLRNPLNVISARSQLARETGAGEHFDKLEAAADRMDRLIDDLLQLARQGQTVNETEQVDLREVAEDAWSLVEAPEASLEVDGTVSVEADRDRLQQAFENLFRNATDHVGPAVKLKIEPLDDGFAVVDNGPGIPAEEQDSVLEYGHTTEEDGTGFGLAIVKEIVEAHGWDIRVMNGDMVASGFNGEEEPEYTGARFEVTGVKTARSFALEAGDSELEFEFGD